MNVILPIFIPLFHSNIICLMHLKLFLLTPYDDILKVGLVLKFVIKPVKLI